MTPSLWSASLFDLRVLEPRLESGFAMTKQELIDRVYRRVGIDQGLTKKAVREVIDGLFSELGDYFVKARVTKNATPKFTYPGFGTFTKKKRAARNGRNPRNGEAMQIPANTTVGFAVGSDLKELMNRRK